MYICIFEISKRLEQAQRQNFVLKLISLVVWQVRRDMIFYGIDRKKENV
jgi:hypothetical protein